MYIAAEKNLLKKNQLKKRTSNRLQIRLQAAFFLLFTKKKKKKTKIEKETLKEQETEEEWSNVLHDHTNFICFSIPFSLQPKNVDLQGIIRGLLNLVCRSTIIVKPIILCSQSTQV